MPRLSVDIDLTYLPIEDREATLKNIAGALERIKTRISEAMPNIKIHHKKDISKLIVTNNAEAIKIEANLTQRGTIKKPKKMILCNNAQEIYNTSAVMQVVPFGQLYGGKICAALDRQHPRDLFDIKLLMENEGFSNDIRKGFLYCLICSERPINELIAPNCQDQQNVMHNQFVGMSEIEFTYDGFLKTRALLVETIHNSLTDADKEFLISIKNCTPDWSIYDFERFPAVQWKLQNLKKLKSSNPDKHKELYEILHDKLIRL